MIDEVDYDPEGWTRGKAMKSSTVSGRFGGSFCEKRLQPPAATISSQPSSANTSILPVRRIIPSSSRVDYFFFELLNHFEG